jgi:outer membrane protein
MKRVGVVKAGTALAVLAAGLMTGEGAQATTLTDALIATYSGNPTLTEQRAQLQATDEQAAIARAGGRPSLGGSVGYTQGINGLRALQGYNRAVTAGAQLNVPLFQGGRVRNAVHAADSRVESGRETLRATEGDVLVQAVSAYMDVVRDRAIVELNINNVKVLQTNLDATNDRFQAGDLTRTDVAQSQARLEDGRSQLTTAKSNLTTSEENYRRVIGQGAGSLDQPPPLPVLPENADRAEDTAVNNNPDIAAAKGAVKAARYDVSTARASRMPTIAATAGTNYYRYSGFAGNGLGVPVGNVSGDASQAGVTLSVPLYQGGLPSAQVRQAQAFESAALERETATERQVVANARSAFSSYQAALEVIRSSQEALKANTLALEGVRAEQSVGERQVLDVLNAEQELLGSQVTLVSAQRDAYVAGFALLNSMGLVDYKHLGLQGGALYDPTMNYRHAIHVVGDWSSNPTPQPVAKVSYGPQVVPENPPVTPASN